MTTSDLPDAAAGLRCGLLPAAKPTPGTLLNQLI